MLHRKNRNYLLAAICALALVTLPAGAAFAGGGGHGAGGKSGLSGNFGGRSAGHMSTQGVTNTNGPNSQDRNYGLGRAQERMNTQGLNHNKAHDNADQGQSATHRGKKQH